MEECRNAIRANLSLIWIVGLAPKRWSSWKTVRCYRRQKGPDRMPAEFTVFITRAILYISARLWLPVALPDAENTSRFLEAEDCQEQGQGPPRRRLAAKTRLARAEDLGTFPSRSLGCRLSPRELDARLTTAEFTIKGFICAINRTICPGPVAWRLDCMKPDFRRIWLSSATRTPAERSAKTGFLARLDGFDPRQNFFYGASG